ncbi:hypothetical protein H0H87_004015 [Tephrocybe sp. NHM501043]|nr:hypothetical protein H0H87_004015 [Tephrocybe sp. NHM501043]
MPQTSSFSMLDQLKDSIRLKNNPCATQKDDVILPHGLETLVTAINDPMDGDASSFTTQKEDAIFPPLNLDGLENLVTATNDPMDKDASSSNMMVTKKSNLVLRSALFGPTSLKNDTCKIHREGATCPPLTLDGLENPVATANAPMDEEPSSLNMTVSETSKESPLFDLSQLLSRRWLPEFEIAEQNLTIKDSGKQIIQLQHECNDLESAQQRYEVELNGDKHMFELELSCYKGSIKHIAKKFKWEWMCQDSLAIVVQVSDLELDCLKGEHQAAQATWMKENRDFKKWLTAADNKVNNSNEVILSLTTKLTTQLDSFKKEQDSIVHYTEKEHTTHIKELQKKIVVLEEDVQDGHKRLEIELNEKSKTAVQLGTNKHQPS